MSKPFRAPLTICAALLAVSPAFGHAKLLGASPAAGSEVAGSSTWLTLTGPPVLAMSG